jgi:uncharacterized protein YxjI
VARNRWLAPEVWEFADPDEGDDYAARRKLTWRRGAKVDGDAAYRVHGEEQREEFQFSNGELIAYQREYLAESESDA